MSTLKIEPVEPAAQDIVTREEYLEWAEFAEKRNRHKMARYLRARAHDLQVWQEFRKVQPS